MRDIKDINRLFEECLREVKDLKIPIAKVSGNISVAPRATRALGIYYTATGDIKISKILLDEKVPEKMVKQTICHEILHGCKGAGGHNKTWKSYANHMNAEYGYKISRCTHPTDYNISYDEIDWKYRIYCNGCGACVARYMRATDSTRHPYRYKCKLRKNSNLYVVTH